MNAIKIDFDSNTLNALQRRARAHGHDVADEVRQIVEAIVAEPPQKVDFVEEFRRIRAMTPKGVEQTPTWKIIRDSRDHDH